MSPKGTGDATPASLASTCTTSASSRSKPLSHPTRAAKPSVKVFDPWNSSSTGHQRAENALSGSTSWRQSRNLKLSEQFRSGPEGGKRVADTVGAGSEDFGKDGRTGNGGWVKGASGLRGPGQMSIVEALGGKKVKSNVSVAKEKNLDSRADIQPLSSSKPIEGDWEIDTLAMKDEPASTPIPPSAQPEPRTDIQLKQIFAGLTVYINGSTYPTISDHKLKHLIAAHGGRMSIALGRKTVTHVILGKTNANGGCGGGLAGGKLQKEINALRHRVKFVGVEWVVESIKADTKLPEARFRVMEMGGERQKSVIRMFGKR